jgi:hypothetical protein
MTGTSSAVWAIWPAAHPVTVSSAAITAATAITVRRGPLAGVR